MPLILTPEDGTGLPGANSYASLADAANYHAASANGALWSAIADDATRSALLVRATRTLDALCVWPGMPVTALQGLRWPRQGVFIDGWPLSSGTVPMPLKNACSEFAATISEDGDPAADLDTSGLAGVTVGTLRVDFKADPTLSTRSDNFNTPMDRLRALLPGNVLALLLPILGNPNAAPVRLVRT